MRAETIFLVLMALAAFMMLGALINTGEHQATLEAKLDMMLKLQEESKNARRPSGELFNVRGRRGDPVARGEERAPAAPPPMIQPGPFRDNANGLLPSHPPAKGVPPGGTRSLEDMYPIPSSIGCRPDGGGYIPTGLEGTPLPKSEEEIVISGETSYLPYPQMQPLTELLRIWPPDQPDIPKHIPNVHAGSLARFDFRDETQRNEAKRLQLHEVPFMLTNVADVDAVVKLWSSDAYLKEAFADRPQHLLRSQSNHFMYWAKKLAKRKDNEGYKPPTNPETVTFEEFLAARDSAEHQPVESEHIYLQLNSDKRHEFIARDLPFFAPKPSWWMVDYHANKGINCRFGARGIIAETHYDGGRNFVAMLRGSKRYVLSPPKDCPNLYLWPKGHPEGRHSKADWSQLDLEKYPLMGDAVGTQVVVRAGEVLYIPSFWFHYIVSQDGSIQCNTRSGTSLRGKKHIQDCGFPLA